MNFLEQMTKEKEEKAFSCLRQVKNIFFAKIVKEKHTFYYNVKMILAKITFDVGKINKNLCKMTERESGDDSAK